MDEEEIVQAEADEFQDTILRSIESHPHPYTVKIKGVEFVLFPKVFNPIYAKASMLLLDNLGVRDGDFVLDPFTGCGADAIFSIREGASQVIAIDKYTMPYLCARYNVNMLGLEKRIDVRQEDLFDALGGKERFDLVIANPPFRNMKPDSDTTTAIRDEQYQTLDWFFGEVGEYMGKTSRMRIVFSDVGDMDHFHHLIDSEGFKSEVVAEDTYASQVKIQVYEMRKKQFFI